MKKRKNISVVVLATILVVTLCSWIFPSASFNSVLVEGERVQVGLFDLFSYPMVAVTYFSYVIVYALVVSIFYGIANKIPAYHTLIEKIKNAYTGREPIFLGLVMALTAIIVSVTGLSFGMIFIFPFVISIVIAMGYNKLVAASVTVGSVAAGLAGTTLGTSSVSYLNQLLGLETMDELVSKIVILVAFIIILIANVLMYAKKTKNTVVEAEVTTSKKKVEVEVNPEAEKVTKKDGNKTTKKTTTTKKDTKTSKSTKTATKTKSTKTKSKSTRASMAKNSDEILKVSAKDTKKVKCWPFVLIFDFILIILALAVFDWSGLFDITWFADAKNAIDGFEIGKFPIFAKLLGTYSEFGSWSFNIEIPVLIMIGSLILALVYRVKFSDIVDGIEDGISKAVKPIITMMLAYIVLIICTYHPFQLMITKFIMGLTSGLNVVTMTIVAMLASLFNVETVYTAQSTVPYVMSVIGDATLYPLVEVIFQAVYGLAMLVVPTSVILIGTLTYLNIPYGQWLKYIWKIFVEVLIVLLIIFLIILAI